MNWLKTYFEYMEDPARALKTFLSARSFSLVCAGYFTAALGWVLFFNIGDGISVASLLAKLMLVFAAEVTAGYFMASLCGLFLDFSRIKASPVELFCLLGSAGFINGLLVVFALYAASWPAAHLNWLAPAAVLLLAGLKLGYLTRALMRVYQIPAARALSGWLFGLVPLGVAGLLTGIFAIWGISLLF